MIFKKSEDATLIDSMQTVVLVQTSRHSPKIRLIYEYTRHDLWPIFFAVPTWHMYKKCAPTNRWLFLRSKTLKQTRFYFCRLFKDLIYNCKHDPISWRTLTPTQHLYVNRGDIRKRSNRNLSVICWSRGWALEFKKKKKRNEWVASGRCPWQSSRGESVRQTQGDGEFYTVDLPTRPTVR